MLARVPARRIALLAIAASLPVAASPALAQPDEDFAPEGGAWNSVSRLMQIARDRGVEPQPVERLDLGALQPNDSLLILYPTQPLPARELTSFLRSGGRILLADDFGAGGSLLDVFQIGRGPPSTERALKLRGNAALLVARPVGSHRLTTGVPALVANHPAIVYHRSLEPIFELTAGEALVLAGAVGPGRLVVLSDPSVLIDNMLELRGNRTFAENAIDYLDDARGGRLFVVGPRARLVGRYGEPGADRPLHDLRASLERLAGLELPPLAIRIASLALAAIAVIFALGALPRRSPYRSDRMFARPPAQGGFVGRVRFFARHPSDLSGPLMVYKLELEAEILRRLSLGKPAVLRDVLSAMRARGMSQDDVEAMRGLLVTLDELRDRRDNGPAPPRVSGKRFREFVALGDRLLARLGEARSA